LSRPVLLWLLQNTRGVAALEFAIIAPVFLIALFGSLQLGYIGWAQNRLENAVREASRVGITGNGQTATMTREQVIRATLDDLMTSVTKSSTEVVTVTPRYYPSFQTLTNPGEPFDDANKNGACDPGEDFYDYNNDGIRSTADIGQDGYGGSGDVVRYEVTYPVKLFLPFINDYFGENGALKLTARTIVRNEVFGVSVTPQTRKC
jgi:Flp pilus assembly protein TadG